MNKLIKISRTFCVLGFLSIASSFLVEWNSLKIKNDDELGIFFLCASIFFLVLFIVTLFWKIHLYGGKLVEKIVAGLGIVVIVFATFMLLVFFTVNINMI